MNAQGQRRWRLIANFLHFFLYCTKADEESNGGILTPGQAASELNDHFRPPIHREVCGIFISWYTRPSALQMCELCTNTNGYAHAVLARDGVSVLGVVDEGHVDSDQGRPVCGQHLTANYRHQAAERQRERETTFLVKLLVNITNSKNIVRPPS